jgi:hypothetical protein
MRRRSESQAGGQVDMCLLWDVNEIRPVVKTRDTSPLERVVAGSNPATGKYARVAQR